jgi:uncharacterized membrane protein (DUF4010 family)
LISRDRVQEQLVAAFIFGALLLLPPLLVIFNQSVRVLGVPLLYLYLFLVWVAVIGITAAIARRIVGGENSGSPAEQATAEKQAPDA